jgi:tetratricopeptide (TPR) repeat protein
MPGHIYVHVDRWDDAARAFENSAEVDRAYIRDNHESSDHTAGPYSHNLHFLAMVYGYQGRYRDALRVSQELLEAARKPGEEKSRAALEGWLSMMRLLVRFEKWDEILDGKTLPDAAPFEVLDGWRLYARGLARLGKGDTRGARADLESLEKESAWLREQFPKHKDLPLAGRQRQLVSGLAVAPFELRGRILAREGKADEAIATLRQAIEEEIKLGYSEPPIYPNPMEEVAGKTAISLGRWSDAEEFFRAALERDPGSGRALFGLMLSQQSAGGNQQARASYARFVKAWARADADLPETQRARENAVAHGYASGKK